MTTAYSKQCPQCGIAIVYHGVRAKDNWKRSINKGTLCNSCANSKKGNKGTVYYHLRSLGYTEGAYCLKIVNRN